MLITFKRMVFFNHYTREKDIKNLDQLLRYFIEHHEHYDSPMDYTMVAQNFTETEMIEYAKHIRL